MSEVKSTTIVPIASYCFLLSFFCLSLAGNSIFGNKEGFSSTDLDMWLPVTAFMIFACGLFAVGMGILNVSNLCWKILFFSLAICVTCIASCIIAFLIFLSINAEFILAFLQTAHISSVAWFCFLSFFLSEIIVLYYLFDGEVVASFGGMGEMISPF